MGTSTSLEFWVKDGEQDGGSLRKVSALLPASGFLGELFHAFGLITKEQLESEAARSQAADVNFLQWLRDTVQEAVFVGQQHDDLKQRIREKRTVIEHSFGLASLVVRRAAARCRWAPPPPPPPPLPPPPPPPAAAPPGQSPAQQW